MTTQLPCVTVLCYTYNHAQFIRDCLIGILEQEGSFSMRVVVRDDCSSDGTQEIVKEFAARYPEVIVPIFESANQWRSQKPLMAVWPYVHGHFLAFCEGDDYWDDSGKLEKQVNRLIADPNASASFHQVIWRDCNTGIERPIWPLSDGAILARADLLHPRTVLTTSALVLRNYPDLPYRYSNLTPNFDGFLTAFLGTKGYAVYEGSISPSIHRRHDGGIRSMGSVASRDLDSLVSHYWTAQYLAGCGLHKEAALHLAQASRIASAGALGNDIGYSLTRSWLQSLTRLQLTKAKNRVNGMLARLVEHRRALLESWDRQLGS